MESTWRQSTPSKDDIETGFFLKEWRDGHISAASQQTTASQPAFPVKVAGGLTSMNRKTVKRNTQTSQTTTTKPKPNTVCVKPQIDPPKGFELPLHTGSCDDGACKHACPKSTVLPRDYAKWISELPEKQNGSFWQNWKAFFVLWLKNKAIEGDFNFGHITDYARLLNVEPPKDFSGESGAKRLTCTEPFIFWMERKADVQIEKMWSYYDICEYCEELIRLIPRDLIFFTYHPYDKSSMHAFRKKSSELYFWYKWEIN